MCPQLGCLGKRNNQQMNKAFLSPDAKKLPYSCHKNKFQLDSFAVKLYTSLRIEHVLCMTRSHAFRDILLGIVLPYVRP